MTDICDPVRPRDHLTLRCHRCGPRPRVVADAVECLTAQIERHEGDIGSPQRMVVAARQVRAEGILARVAAGAVPAIVAERDRLGECDIESERPRDRDCDLGHLEGVGQASALVVVGEDEDLGLACQTPERRRMQDAVTVAFETGAELIGFLFDEAVAAIVGAGCQERHRFVLRTFSSIAIDHRVGTWTRPRICVGKLDPGHGVAGHRRGPALGALLRRRVGMWLVHLSEAT